MKDLKKRLQKGETLLGCWLNLGSSITAEMVGLTGFDWVLIDLEHGTGGENNVISQLQALAHTPSAPIVRVESSERHRIHRVLDFGAEGVMCPRIYNVEDAKKVANGLQYTPKGSRGVAKMVRCTEFGKNFTDYHNNASENIVGIAQIETAESLNHLDEIAALDGIDVLFIGPADLSMDLGVFGQFDAPVYKEALRDTVNAANKAGKSTGILIFDPADFKLYHDMGIRFIACGADASFVSSGAKNVMENLTKQRSNLNK